MDTRNSLQSRPGNQILRDWRENLRVRAAIKPRVQRAARKMCCVNDTVRIPQPRRRIAVLDRFNRCPFTWGEKRAAAGVLRRQRTLLVDGRKPGNGIQGFPFFAIYANGLAKLTGLVREEENSERHRLR